MIPCDDEILVTKADFSIEEEYRRLLDDDHSLGACVLFTGLVRDLPEAGSLQSLELEHYPGMTEASIAEIVARARARWNVARVRVIHRIGKLAPGDQIVLVAVAGAHRGEAFAACEYVMDYLKTRAPLWKKETTDGRSRWVDSRESDEMAAARWET